MTGKVLDIKDITVGMTLHDLNSTDNLYAPICGPNGSIVVEDIDSGETVVVFTGETACEITHVGAKEIPSRGFFSGNATKDIMSNGDEQLSF